MVTITLTHEEMRRVRKLVRADFTCNSGVVRTYQCSVAEKNKYAKAARKAEALLKKIDAFGDFS